MIVRAETSPSSALQWDFGERTGNELPAVNKDVNLRELLPRLTRSDNYKSVNEMKPLYTRYCDEAITVSERRGLAARLIFQTESQEGFFPSAGYRVAVAKSKD